MDIAKKWKPWKRNWISSDSNTKQCHKDNVHTRIDETQLRSRCRLCGDRDETITHIISECNKLALESIRPDTTKWGRWSTRNCKKFKFDHTNKWYMHNLEFVLENETHEILWDFEIQTHHLISARRLDRPNYCQQQKKRTCQITDFAVQADYRVKLEKKKQKEK